MSAPQYSSLRLSDAIEREMFIRELRAHAQAEFARQIGRLFMRALRHVNAVMVEATRLRESFSAGARQAI
jgi:hypothetical protein